MAHVMFGGLTHPPAVELGRKLCAILPPGLDKIFFCDSGSVAVEVAVKIALQYWRALNEARKTRLLALRYGYHGDTFAAMSVCDPVGGMHHLFQGTLPTQIFARAPRCGSDCDDEAVADLERKLKAHAHETAAMILEPMVQGAGGMRIYGAGYLEHARRLCERHRVLLIFDEIATGFGRTGKTFALEHVAGGDGATPDILCVGKALSAGYLSLAATITHACVSEVLDAGDPGVLMHGPTYMANPLACAAACASLDLLARGDWRARVARIESLLEQRLAPCRMLEGVRDVRVLGAVGVVELEREVDVGAWCRAFARARRLDTPVQEPGLSDAALRHRRRRVDAADRRRPAPRRRPATRPLTLPVEAGEGHVAVGVYRHVAGAGQALYDVGGGEAGHLRVFPVPRGQQAVGENLAPLHDVWVFDPAAAHLPSAIHVGVETGEEVLGLDQQFLGHLDLAGVPGGGHFQPHPLTRDAAFSVWTLLPRGRRPRFSSRGRYSPWYSRAATSRR